MGTSCARNHDNACQDSRTRAIFREGSERSGHPGRMKHCVLMLLLFGCVADDPEDLDIAEATTLRAKAITRLRAAADYFDINVRRAGGYAWHSLDTDLNERWGDARMPN